MKTLSTGQIGFWTGIILVILGMAYLGLVVVMIASGSGFPPVEPFQSIVNVLILLTAVSMVFFWVILNQVVPAEKKVFSQASLAFIVISAALTSINRYVGLTVVRQSIASGNTDGLQWFLPYGWPSIMLAIEFLAWGFFFGLACLCLAPVFTNGKLEHAISWALLATGALSLIACLGQLIGSNGLTFSPFTLAGTIGWGPGLTSSVILLVVWIKRGGEFNITDG